MTETGRRYIDLLKSSLANELYIENEARLIYVFNALLNHLPLDPRSIYGAPNDVNLAAALRNGKAIGQTVALLKASYDGTRAPAPEMRNFLELSHSMIGRARLDNLQHCVEAVLQERVPGDFIETGVWRGGACILMRGLLAAHEVTDRIVWAADSFEGVPAPSYPQDAGWDISASVLPVLAVSLDEVRNLFARYGLLDERVRFLKGWFKDTLPTAPIEHLAVLRLDGDLYESTMDALWALYHRVSPRGFIIVDDYFSCPPCGRAIEEFRSIMKITTPMQRIDDQSVFWRKEA
jgi:hypothetical protein